MRSLVVKRKPGENYMIGLYFSSTGNTKYVVERFIKAYDESGKCYSIEEKHIATIFKGAK